MKTWIVVALLIVTGITLGGVATYTYIQKQTIRKEQAAIAASNQAEVERQAQAQTKAQTDKLTSTIAVLRAECQKGVTAYGQLTVQQKTKVQPISCDAGLN